MNMSIKSIPFNVFQGNCCERRFKYMGKAGHFFVSCALGSDMCNNRVCKIWNSDVVESYNKNYKGKSEFPDDGNFTTDENLTVTSLRSINVKLKNTLPVEQRVEQHDQIEDVDFDHHFGD
jgi:hypothetical protein